MIPIAVGLATVAAALLVSACGGGDDKNNANAGDSGTDGMAGSDGAAGAAGQGAAAGSGGVAGSGGSGGTSGTDGAADGGSMGGTGGSSLGDASSPDSTTQQSVPYSFGFRYGTTSINRFQGNGTLIFSNNCQLIGGTFDAEPVGGGQGFGMSVNLSGNQSINFCGSQVELPLDGGIFDGVTWMLTNHSDPLSSKEFYQITACEAQEDAGAPLENCEGGLSLNP